MAEELKVTTPPVEGVPAEKPAESQPTVPSSQEPAQPENTGQAQVESPVEQPLQAEEETRQPSDYYKSRDKYRRRVDSLEQAVSDVQNQITTKDVPSVPSTDPGRLDAQKLYDNPEAVFTERERQMEERMTRKFEQHYNRSLGKKITSRRQYNEEMKKQNMVPYEQGKAMAKVAVEKAHKDYKIDRETKRFLIEVKSTASPDGKIKLGSRALNFMKEKGVSFIRPDERPLEGGWEDAT